jgi:hypothetical protein
VPLTEGEREILYGITDVDPDQLAGIPHVNKFSLDFLFDDGKDAPDPEEVDHRLVRWLASMPQGRRLWRAYRRPATTSAAGQATCV